MSQENPHLDAVYWYYVENRGPNVGDIDLAYQKLWKKLHALPRQTQNQIECAVNELCAAYEHDAFMNGLCAGARLILDLTR